MQDPKLLLKLAKLRFASATTEKELRQAYWNAYYALKRINGTCYECQEPAARKKDGTIQSRCLKHLKDMRIRDKKRRTL